MQILINISEGHYKTLQRMKDVGLGYYNGAILNGKVIPEDATNGDVIKALFPNGRIWLDMRKINYDTHKGTITFDVDWWNAPYKIESPESEG